MSKEPTTPRPPDPRPRPPDPRPKPPPPPKPPRGQILTEGQDPKKIRKKG